MPPAPRARRWAARGLAWAIALGAVVGQPVLAQGSTAKVAIQRGDHIVAVVNNELVTAVEVAQRAERLQAELRQAGATVPAEPALRQQALDLLIDERVQITHARDSGYKVDEVELERAVANIAAQNRLTPAQLRERLKEDGMDWTRFRANLRDQILMERVREREVIGRIRVSEDEVEAAVASQAQAQRGESELGLAQILVKIPDGASEAQIAERRARIEAARARLDAGDDFAKVAREFSEDATREAGGDMGMRPASRWPDLFTAAVADLKPGEVTAQPLRSGAGFHLVKLVERKSEAGLAIRQTRARHILLRVPDGTPAASVARRMGELRAEIAGGKRSFETVAQAVSEDGSAAQGGDLGWVGAGQFVPEFEQAMDQLAPGALSQPVVSRFGVHLIQVLERRQVEVDPKAVREQVRSQLRERKFDAAYADWVKELRLRAYIEMRESPVSS